MFHHESRAAPRVTPGDTGGGVFDGMEVCGREVYDLILREPLGRGAA